MVVVEPYIGPSAELPLLPSDREDSEFRDGSANCGSGSAREVVSSSPYEGGADPGGAVPGVRLLSELLRCIADSRCKSSNPLLFPLLHFNDELFPVVRFSSVDFLGDMRPLEEALLKSEGLAFLPASPSSCSTTICGVSLSMLRSSVVGAVLTIVGRVPSTLGVGTRLARVGIGGRSSSNRSRSASILARVPR